MDFLGRLDGLAKQKEKAWWWSDGRTLASIGRDDPATIRELAARLSGPPAVAGNAAMVLGMIGGTVSALVPDIVERLLALSRHEIEFVRLAALGSLGALGAGLPAVSERLVEAVLRGKNYEPGYAIDSLSPATVPAGTAVPLLIAQFATFEEFDPDRTYQGEHARLAEALMRYGSEAALAVPILASHVAGEEGTNESVLNCLGMLGPLASAAVPALELAARKGEIENLMEDVSPLGAAWRSIKGK